MSASLARFTGALCATLGLRGTPLSTPCFHVSLHFLNEDADLRHDIVRKATEAAATVTLAPFTLTFDRVMSFASRAARKACVLCDDGGNLPLHRFRRELSAALTRAGLGHHVAGPFRPHVTLFYADAIVAERLVEPVSWTVREFVLIDSLVGRARHVVRGRWRLFE